LGCVVVQSLELSQSALLRQKYRTAFFAKDARNSPSKCLLVVCMNLAIVAAACAIANYCFQRSIFAGIWFWIVSGVVCGSRMRALGNILHECSHCTFAKTKNLNKRWGHVLGIFLFIGFAKYRREHLSHHRYLGDSAKDLDLGGRFFKPTLVSSEEPLWANVGRIISVLLILVLTAFPSTRIWVLGGYVVPYLTTYQCLKWISDKADHSGISNESCEFMRSRNHIFKLGFMNWLFFPHSDSFHLVHHLFPGLPSRMHSKCHAVLLRESVYAARKHAIDVVR
jgi:fatty acid desaturase